jgi:DUF1365 family protein
MNSKTRSNDAAALYVGHVMHARMKPFTHRFRYDVFSLLIDIDGLQDASRMSALFSVERFNLLSFKSKDHGPRDGSCLRAHVDRLLGDAGTDTRPARVMLLCYPRILGFTFNPLSVYYCFDEKDELAALIYEVRNTFGDIHSYVAPVQANERKSGEIRQERDKIFYVSPFLEMPLRYRFRLTKPDETLRLRILEVDQEGPILAATFSGDRRPFTTSSILKVCAAIPLLTFKVVAGIHWEALKIWLKGAKIQPRPQPPERASFGETGRAEAEPSAAFVVRPHR